MCMIRRWPELEQVLRGDASRRSSSSTMTEPTAPLMRRLTAMTGAAPGRQTAQQLVLDGGGRDQQAVHAPLVQQPREGRLGGCRVQATAQDQHVARFGGAPLRADHDGP